MVAVDTPLRVFPKAALDTNATTLCTDLQPRRSGTRRGSAIERTQAHRRRANLLLLLWWLRRRLICVAKRHEVAHHIIIESFFQC